MVVIVINSNKNHIVASFGASGIGRVPAVRRRIPKF